MILEANRKDYENAIKKFFLTRAITNMHMPRNVHEIHESRNYCTLADSIRNIKCEFITINACVIFFKMHVIYIPLLEKILQFVVIFIYEK